MNDITDEAKDLIKEFEGERLQVYVDPAGKRTIGIGHLITPDDDIGDTITQEQCDEIFEKDLSHASSLIEQFITTPLNDNQRGALVSLCFNEGVAPLEGTLGEKLNAGDMVGAANEFLRWVYAGGRLMAGLVRRRDAERALFLKV